MHAFVWEYLYVQEPIGSSWYIVCVCVQSVFFSGEVFCVIGVWMYIVIVFIVLIDFYCVGIITCGVRLIALGLVVSFVNY